MLDATRGFIAEEESPRLLMKCVICSRELPEGAEECPNCFPPGAKPPLPDEITTSMATLLRKARGWVLVGFAVLPGWIAFPASFKYATDALVLYKEAGLEDPELEFRISRLRLVSGALSVVYWTFTIWWLVASRFGQPQ